MYPEHSRDSRETDAKRADPLVPLMRHVIRGRSCANLIISSAYSAAHQSRPWKLPASARLCGSWREARLHDARARVSQVYFQIRTKPSRARVHPPVITACLSGADAFRTPDAHSIFRREWWPLRTPLRTM